MCSSLVSRSVKGFPAELWAELKACAARNRITMREALVKAVQLYLQAAGEK